jgi:Fe-S-cluster containining protein
MKAMKRKPCGRCCFSIRVEEAVSPFDREIDANQKHVMSDHDKNLFIVQLYAIVRGSVKETLAVEPTQDAAIEKARKLESDAAIHVERIRNVGGGGRDKWRRI